MQSTSRVFTVALLVALFGLAMSSTPLNSDLTCDEVNEFSDGKYHIAEYSNTCYLFVMDKRTTYQGWQFCRDLGGFLADIDDDTGTFLKNYTSTYNRTRYPIELKTNFIVGYMYSEVLGGWHWDTGSQVQNIGGRDLKALAYRKGVPLFYEYRFCSKITTEDLILESFKCDETHPFVCQFKAQVKTNEESNERTCRTLCQKVHENFQIPSTTPAPNITSRATTVETTGLWTESPSTENRTAEPDGKEDVTRSPGTNYPQTNQTCEGNGAGDSLILLVFLLISLILNLGFVCGIIYMKCRQRRPSNPTPKRALLPESSSGAAVELRDISATRGSNTGNNIDGEGAEAVTPSEPGGEVYSEVNEKDGLASDDNPYEEERVYQNQSNLEPAHAQGTGRPGEAADAAHMDDGVDAEMENGVCHDGVEGVKGEESAAYYSSFSRDADNSVNTSSNVYGSESACVPFKN